MANVYRADHVGSLITPEPPPTGWGPAAAQAVNGLLSMQKECGMGIVSDGELLRTSACSLFAGNIAGIQSDSGSDRRPYVAGPLQRTARLTAREVDLLRRTAVSPFKITLPAPTVAALELFRDGVTNAHYPTRHDLAQAVAAILRQEIADLIAESVPYVQLNGPAYEAVCELAGDARLGSVEEMLDLDAKAIRDLPRPGKCTLAIHLPRARDGSGALIQNARLAAKRSAMVEAALAAMPVDRFLIELPAEPAEADFAPLRAVPQGKMAVLGLVDPLAPSVDDVDPLLDRLDFAVTYVGEERLALSPRQGFAAPDAARHAQAFEAQCRSLTLTAETARRFWGFEM